MPRKLPPLNALRAFEAAGRHGSFTGAAEELGVSHSAISRHVRGLEDRLEVQFFRDEARGVSLTPAGAQYLAEISPALDSIADATEAFTAKASGRVRLNSEPIFATKWLMPRLPEFFALYPDVDLQIEASEALADMGRFEADLALRFFKEGCPDRPSDLISNAPIYPYAAPGMIEGELLRPEQILSYKLYQDRRGDLWQQWFAANGWDPVQVPTYAFRMRSALCVEAAVNRMGIILASSDVMEYEVETGRLVQISAVPIYRGSYHLLYGDGVARQRAVRVFRDWLIDASQDLRRADAPQ